VNVIDVQQGSPEWLAARRGLATASNFHRIITAKKMELSAQADDLICEMIAERYGCGPTEDMGGFANAAMRNGIMLEPEARAYYEMTRGVDVRQAGLIVSDCGMFGCSPDGLVGDDGGLECKSPQGKTHIGWLLAGGLPPEHRAQVHGSLIITGRAWWDFQSYCPGLPELLVRVEPDDFTEALRRCMAQFADRYAAIVAALNLPPPQEKP
jgi:hypothetical protein